MAKIRAIKVEKSVLLDNTALTLLRDTLTNLLNNTILAFFLTHYILKS